MPNMHQRQVALFCALLRGSLTSSPPAPNPLAKVLLNARTFCASSGEQEKPPAAKEYCNGVELPEEPTNCCMSGCANCVWIEYAKQLKTIFCCSDDKTQEIILKKIDDPSMKAFLAMELKMMEK